MKIEIRADGAHLSGYVNVTEKKSRPVITPHGRVIEEVEPGAFGRALERAENVVMTKDHGAAALAETRAGTLALYEDGIGLHYDAVITDPCTVEEARTGKIRGLSFGMNNVVDTVEARADSLPLRRIKDLDLDHITLVIKKNPVYSATSVELRAEVEVNAEERAMDDSPRVTDASPAPRENSAFKARLDAVRRKHNDNTGRKSTW